MAKFSHREAVTNDIALMRGFLEQAQIDLDTMEEADRKELHKVLSFMAETALLYGLERDKGDRLKRQRVARNIFPLFTATFTEMWKRVANNLLLDDIYSILETE